MFFYFLSFIFICYIFFFFFFFNDTATTEIYTLSLHDALRSSPPAPADRACNTMPSRHQARSEEHTSELQSQSNIVCRLLLEKKKKNKYDSRPKKLRKTRPTDKNRIQYT